MNVLAQVAIGWQCLVVTLRQFSRWALWAPWLVLGCVQLLTLAALWWFAHPWISWLLAPRLAGVAGEEALHYPNLFRLLPGLFARADLVIGALVGSLAIGASTVLFAARFTGAEPRAGVACAQALRRGLPLILANLPLNLLLMALTYGLEAWLADRGVGGATRRLAGLAGLGGAVLVQALMLFVNAHLMLAGTGLIEGFARLPRAAARGFWAALLISSAALVPLLPIQQLMRASGKLIERGRPELVGWLVALQVVAALVAAFVLTGGITLAYQSAVADPAEDGAP